jgi:hypothetical protein
MYRNFLLFLTGFVIGGYFGLFTACFMKGGGNGANR